MTYNEALNYIESVPMGDRKGLRDINKLLLSLGNPQDNLKVIHVAGTNGKGSVCTYVAEMLRAMGYSVGLFTSPYLEVFNERIRLDGQNISDEDLAKALSPVKEQIEILSQEEGFYLSQFDIITAMAYEYYSDKRPDFVVLEVGLGGEFDSTNTCKPVISVIASISMDHTEYLGNTIEAIASTKAGIIKEHTPVVLYHQTPVVEKIVRQKALDRNSKLFIADFSKIDIQDKSLYGQELSVEVLGRKFQALRLSMQGDHQAKNFVTALTALLVLGDAGILRIPEDTEVLQGAKNAKWNGRTELFCDRPVTILDGAHNADGALVLANYIREYLRDYYLIMVFGVLGDKQIELIVNNLIPLADQIILTEPPIYRAENVEELKKIIQEQLKTSKEINIVKDVSAAVAIAQEIAEDYKGDKKAAVLYSGSLYLIGEARSALKKYYHINK